MFKKIVFIICLIGFSGCASIDPAHPLFLNHAKGHKVDCGNGKWMMSYELCRLDAYGY